MASEAPVIESAGNRWALPNPPRHTSTLLKVRREAVQMPFWGEKSGLGHGGVLAARRVAKRRFLVPERADVRSQQELQ